MTIPVGYEAITESKSLSNGNPVAVYGFCFAPENAESVTFEFYDGDDDTGQLVFGTATTDVAGRSSTQELGGCGVVFSSGCYVKITGATGSGSGSVWLQRI